MKNIIIIVSSRFVFRPNGVVNIWMSSDWLCNLGTKPERDCIARRESPGSIDGCSLCSSEREGSNPSLAEQSQK